MSRGDTDRTPDGAAEPDEAGARVHQMPDGPAGGDGLTAR